MSFSLGKNVCALCFCHLLLMLHESLAWNKDGYHLCNLYTLCEGANEYKIGNCNTIYFILKSFLNWAEIK